MPVKMTEEQLSFWRELLAPFRDDELSVKRIGGRDLTYIDKRSLANRLDSVVGPDGWFTEYRDEGGRGLVCRLYLLIPTANGSRISMYKEEGGADEGMTKKVGGDNLEDVDNNFKSEFTNAFRRAAQDAWGIGRYLYQKGIPSFLDPRATPASPVQRQQSAPAPAPTSVVPAKTYDEAYKAQAAAPVPNPPQGQRTFDNFKIPRPGKSVFAWAKEMEKTFETALLAGMNADALEFGYPKVFADWTEDQVKVVATNVIQHIKTLPTYKGQFDHLDIGGPPAADNQVLAQPINPGDTAEGLAGLKKTLMNLMQQHVVKSIGRRAEQNELKASFMQIASHCQNGNGHMGEIPESLGGLGDRVWIENMIAFVRDQIANCPVQQPVQAPEDEINF